MTDTLPTSALPRGVTAYLKGVAILAVVVNHYAILYFYAPQTYANSLMSFFFLFSGAGIYLSLERDRALPGGARRVLASYVYKRARRIYPLYWLAYGIFIFELYAVYGFTESFAPLNLIAAFAGFPVNPRGIYWFVTAILQCYIFAPLLMAVVRKQGATASLGTGLMLLGASLLASVFLLQRVGNETLRDMLEYQGLFLGNVLLFFLGMLIPLLVVQAGPRLGKTAIWAGAALVLGLMVYLTDAPDRLFAGSAAYLAPLLFLAAFLFCLSLAAASPRLPLDRLVMLAGDYTYPVYLLHLPFFILLAWAGVIRENSYASAVYSALLFPLFFATCVGLQRALANVPGRWRS